MEDSLVPYFEIIRENRVPGDTEALEQIVDMLHDILYNSGFDMGEGKSAIKKAYWILNAELCQRDSDMNP